MTRTPAWWPQVVAAADRRRHVTGLLLAHATPVLDRDVLRLQFTRPDIAQTWRDSRAQDALEAALASVGKEMSVKVALAPTC